MAIVGNNSDKSVAPETKFYTGVCSVKIDDVNPTLAESQKLGFNFQKEPEYITEKEGVKGIRLDFYVSNSLFRSKVSVFLKNEIRKDKNKEKTQFINKFATTTWAITKEEALEKTAKNGKKWFLPEGVREAFIGEEQLYSLLQNWLNVKIGDELQLNNFSKLFNGETKELKDLIKSFGSNTFKVLSQVSITEDNKIYQQINNNIFDRATSSTSAKFIKYADDQKKAGYPIKDAFSIEFKQYIPVYKESIPDSQPEEVTPSDFKF